MPLRPRGGVAASSPAGPRPGHGPGESPAGCARRPQHAQRRYSRGRPWPPGRYGRRREGRKEGGRASRGAGDGGRAVTGRCGLGQPPALGSARSVLQGRLPPSSGPSRALLPRSRSGAEGPGAASFHACRRRRERRPSLSPVGRRASTRSKSPAVPRWRPAASWGAELLVGVPELRAGLAAWPCGCGVSERRQERRGARRPGSALGGASKASEFPCEWENLSFENFSFWHRNLRSSIKAVRVSRASEMLVSGKSARLRGGAPAGTWCSSSPLGTVQFLNALVVRVGAELLCSYLAFLSYKYLCQLSWGALVITDHKYVIWSLCSLCSKTNMKCHWKKRRAADFLS